MKEIPRTVRMSNQIKANNQKVSDISTPDAEPPKMVKRLIELCADLDLTNSDVDRKMMEEFPHLVDEGWKIGTTTEKLKKYEILNRSVKEARALIWREVGLSRKDAYKVIADAMEADKTTLAGGTEPDHKIRLDASDRFLALNGESVKGAGMSVNIGKGDHKIMIVTSSGEQLGDCV